MKLRNQIMGNSWNVPGVDPRLVDVLSMAAQNSPYQVKVISGERQGDPRFHGKGMAVDVELIDPQTGQKVPNYQNAAAFRAYEQFAQTARQIQQQKYPELSNAMRWGGYFSGPKGKYGAADLMHFDLGGERIGMGGGSWDNGLTEAQRKLFPGVQSVGMAGQPQQALAYQQPKQDASPWGSVLRQQQEQSAPSAVAAFMEPQDNAQMADNSADDLMNDPVLKKYLKAAPSSAPAQTVPDNTAGDADLENDPLLKKYLKAPEPAKKGVPADAVPGPNGLKWNKTGGYDPDTGELVVAGKPMSGDANAASSLSKAASEYGPSARTAAAASGFLEGVPFVGQALESGVRAVGAAGSALANEIPYSQARQQIDAGIDTANNVNWGTNLAGRVGGGVTATAMAAPAVAGTMGEYLLGTGGTGFLGNVFRGTTSGAAQGFVHGASNSEDGSIYGRVINGLRDAGVGAGIGAGASAVMSGLGAGASWAGNKLINSDALAGIPSRAANWIMDSLSPAELSQVKSDMSALGQGATPADVSPMWSQAARGAGSQPEMRNSIFQPMLDREAGADQRIADTLSNAIGNVKSPRAQEASLDELRKAANDIAFGPVWENAPQSVDVSSAVKAIDEALPTAAGATKTALQNMRSQLVESAATEGTAGVRTPVLGPNGKVVRYETTAAIPGKPETYISDPQKINNTLFAFDQLVSKGNPALGIAPAAVNAKDAGITTVRKALSDALKTNVPGYEAAMKQAEINRLAVNAVEDGFDSLDKGKGALWPEDLQAIKDKASPEVWDAVQNAQAARIVQEVGLNRNDLAKLKSLIGKPQDFNARKLAITFGDEKAGKIMNMINRESIFQNTNNYITGNAATAGTMALNKLLDGITEVKPSIMDGASLSNGIIPKMIGNALKIAKADRNAKTLMNVYRGLGKISVSDDPAMIDQLANSITARRAVQQVGNRIVDGSAPLAQLGYAVKNKMFEAKGGGGW